MSNEQDYYIEVLARQYMYAWRNCLSADDSVDASYYEGRRDATEDIAQALGVKVRMRHLAADMEKEEE